MKQVHNIIVITAVLFVSLTNTGVLQAIHLHQSCGSSHNSDRCPLCIQIASVKAVSLGFAEHIGFTVGIAEKSFIFRNVFLPAVSLLSQSPRGPPFIS